MKILLFEPYAEWTPHFGAFLEIAQTHLYNGDEVHVINCSGQLTICDLNTNKIDSRCTNCIRCRDKGLSTLDGYQKIHFHPLDFSLLQVDRDLDFNSQDDLEALTYLNFDVGSAVFSSFVSITRNPKPDVIKHKSLLNEWVQLACNTFSFAISAIEKINPDRVYIFNGRLSHLRAFRRACEKTSTEYIIHERGATLDSFDLYPSTIPHDIAYVNTQINNYWNGKLNTDFQRIYIANKFYTDRRSGVVQNWHSFITQQEKSKLPEDWDNTKINISIFNSSEDEFVSIGKEWKRKLFPNQVRAIREICEEFKDDIRFQFFLRVHPNLKNAERKLISELQSLSSLTNLTIIEPNSSVDTYGLIESSDLSITFGSTVGIESHYWGTPSVLLGSSMYMYLPGIYQPKAKSELFDYITKGEYENNGEESALKYGYYQAVRGYKYKFFKPSGLFDGTFHGNKLKYNSAKSKLIKFTNLFHKPK